MTATPLTLDDLMAMNSAQLHQVMLGGHAVDPAAVAGRQFLGVDLSLPGFMRKLLWHTFRKTFIRDEAAGGVRGWNVRMKQLGVYGPREPLRDAQGRPLSFGHYRLKSAEGIVFPRGWKGGTFLDYGHAGNTFFDMARLGYTPLVAVNPGSHELLLGWEVFKIGPWMLPFSLYWALRDEGPVDSIVAPPLPRKARGDPRLRGG